ncbi:MAG TPA: 23S rRNA (adenine(2503)-C(2))-methyltransferase RlmN, partial [Pedobacter sp.]
MLAITKTDIRSLDLIQLQQHFTEMNEPAYRAKQVYQWLWEKSAHSFEEMSNLSKDLRKKLDQNYSINAVAVSNSQFSNDHTIKSSFRLYDGNIVEGVLIPMEERMTACVSSQVGCSLTCKFCATGYMDRKRNLNADEIYDQVVLIDQQAKKNYNAPLTNIVYMGMGEPLLNY